MNYLRSFIICTVFCFSMNFQLSAQCSNINSPSTRGPNTQVFGKMSFGQSIDGACFSGNQITKFSFWSQGNSPTKLHLNIYEGNSQTASGTAIYTENDISLPPANFGNKLTINLKNPVAVQSNKVYTFVLTIRNGGGGNLIAHISEDKYAGGQFFLDKNDGKGGFNAQYDLRFEVETGDAPKLVCSGIGTTITLGKVTGENIEIIIEKDPGHRFTVFPPDNEPTPLEFINVTHSLDKGDGVGPQAGTGKQTWSVNRTNSSSPAVIKFKNDTCGGMSLELLK